MITGTLIKTGTIAFFAHFFEYALLLLDGMITGMKKANIFQIAEVQSQGVA